MKIVDINTVRQKRMEKEYIKYYGNQVKTVKQRTHLSLVQVKDMEEYDLSEYIELLEEEGIDTTDLDIIKPDPTIPW